MQGFGNMMNLTTIYGIYGEEKGINIYKYYDLHTMLSVTISQFLISYFGSDYYQAMVFFSALNVLGILVLCLIKFPKKQLNQSDD